jgi:2-keto-4-pentenoate hydratase/2-oxohepta-3-ene-1,7-dioic acid hydratase in catechol pathway
MRLVTFEKEKTVRIGALIENDRKVVDLTAAGFGNDLNEMIAAGTAQWADVSAAVSSASMTHDAKSLQILAPLPKPRRNIMCVGKNYYEHAEEFHNSGFDSTGKGAVPEFPIIFTKAPSSVIGPGAAINVANDYSNSTDYEGEIAVVIGTGGRNISKADAYDHVFGYTIINDVTARTLQHQHNQWFIGKSVDTYCPMGPVLATSDEIANVNDMHMITRVNGEIRQDVRASDMIFDIPTTIETLSRTMMLEPGDVIATGTCAGVGIGFKPPKYLKAGDVVEIEVSGIGTLSNEVIG